MNKDNRYKEKIIKRFNEIGLIYFKPVKLTSGIKSSFYCNIKKAYGYPDILKGIVKLAKFNIPKKILNKINCVAGYGYGGLPLASLISTALNKKLILVRDKPKKHGKKGLIDGYQPNPKDFVLLVDDVLTTGSSIKKAISVLKKTKCKILGALVVVKRGEAKLPIPYFYIFSIEELVKNRRF